MTQICKVRFRTAAVLAEIRTFMWQCLEQRPYSLCPFVVHKYRLKMSGIGEQISYRNIVLLVTMRLCQDEAILSASVLSSTSEHLSN